MKNIYFIFILMFGSNGYGQTNYEPKNGDIIFQNSNSEQCQAISLATKSTLTHCGVIFNDSVNTYVLEAVQPVRFTLLQNFIERGKNKAYYVKRLINDTLLTQPKLNQLFAEGSKYLEKNYDIYFDWSDREMYCSELVWKMYKQTLGIELGTLNPLKSYDLSSKIVHETMKSRYGDEIPYDALMVAPIDIYNSNLLFLVYSSENKK